MELKDDSKDTFIEAIGLSIHSTRKASVLSYVAIFENLWKQSELFSEIKESNENLRVTNEKLKINDNIQKEFINTAAHELRTPIQPIMSLSELLKNKIKDKEQKELLDIILKNAKKLKKLTEDILDVTKIEGNTLYLNKEKFRIGDLLQSIIKEFEYSIEDYKKIKFELHFENIDPNLVVIADQNRISQVISNLINNSIKFILKEDEKKHDTGLISTRVEKIKINDVDNDDKVIIHIKDNGEGINQEIFPRLFTKFASKSFQGTGLGLFIAKNIIEAHGGKIWAKNNEGEKGANFSFILPVFHK
jgi:signal transduction histidine kinase